MLIMPSEALTFDDVLLVPQHSTIKSRSSVDLSVKLPKGFSVNSPVVPANMRDVVSQQTAQIFYDQGCLVVLHRFGSDHVEDQLNVLDSLNKRKESKLSICCSIGTRVSEKSNVEVLIERGFNIVCIDVAHGDSISTLEMIEFISVRFPNVLLIAGNVATAEGAVRLWKAGADIVKVGIGPGSICTTRKETGNGVPQMTALSDVHDARLTLGKHLGRQLGIIADGGIRSSGDCVKALCFADLVMIGGLFASTVEAPGDLVTVDGRRFKKYSGSSTHKSNRIEGTIVLRPTNGDLKDVIQQLTEGIQSGCSYQNCHNVSDLKEDPVFVRVSTGQQNLDQNKETFRR